MRPAARQHPVRDDRTADREAGLCLNCDNRHGCRTASPVCLESPRSPDEEDLPGKRWMERHGLLHLCASCGLFCRCWSREAHDRMVRGRAG